MNVKQNDTRFVEKAMAAVADPYRMSILQEILAKGSIRCCKVVSLTGLSQPTVRIISNCLQKVNSLIAAKKDAIIFLR